MIRILYSRMSFTPASTLTGMACGGHLVHKLVIPNADALRQFVMCEMHDSPWRGHVGVKKTRKAIERLYTWPSLKDDAEKYVRTCPCCQRNKAANQKPAGLLQPLPVPTRNWGSVSTKAIIALPETSSGNTAIVVFVDRLTKWFTLLPARLPLELRPLLKCSGIRSLGYMEYSMSL